MKHDELKLLLDKMELPRRGRIKLVADKTAYSAGMVSKMLSGHADISDRFLSSLSNAFSDQDIAADVPQNITLRDQFAMAALQGILSNVSTSSYHEGNNGEPIPQLVALRSYEIADAMITARGNINA